MSSEKVHRVFNKNMKKNFTMEFTFKVHAKKYIVIKIEFQMFPYGYFNIKSFHANICKTFDKLLLKNVKWKENNQ